MGFWSWLLDEPQIRDETPEITPPVSDVLLKALLNTYIEVKPSFSETADTPSV